MQLQQAHTQTVTNVAITLLRLGAPREAPTCHAHSRQIELANEEFSPQLACPYIEDAAVRGLGEVWESLAEFQWLTPEESEKLSGGRLRGGVGSDG